jgi:hypothetical protein
MSVELAIAGFGCLALAAGHTTAGLQVLPRLTKTGVPATSFGSAAVTVGMLRFTWHMVTLVLLTFAGLLLWLAWAADAEPKAVLLRWLALLWLAATAMGIWMARRRLTNLIRLPVPMVSAVIAVMCWKASL